MSQGWMPLYIGDFVADTMHLSAQEFGAYMRIVLHYWKTHKPPPDNDATLCRIAVVHPPHWPKVRRIIEPFFDITKTPGYWVHHRVEFELSKAAEISNKNREAALQMHSKRRANALQSHMPLKSQVYNSSEGKSTTPRTRANGASPDTANGRFYAKFDSPQLHAWEAYTGRQLRDRNGGWEFPTEWPPNIGEQPQAH